MEAKGKNGSQHAVGLPMKDIVAFMATCQRSINERQDIFEGLMNTIQLYADGELDQENVELKLSSLSSKLKICNLARGIIISEFTRTSNPLEVPEVHAAFMKWIDNPDDFFGKNKEALDSQRENEQWGKLCTLCQNEVKKASDELVQILKVGGSAQITEQTERQD